MCLARLKSGGFCRGCDILKCNLTQNNVAAAVLACNFCIYATYGWKYLGWKY